MRLLQHRGKRLFEKGGAVEVRYDYGNEHYSSFFLMAYPILAKAASYFSKEALRLS